MIDVLIRAGEFTDAAAIASLHVASWRDSFRGMIPDAVLDGPMLDERLPMWRQVLAIAPAGRLVLVATPRETPEEIVAFASAGRIRGRRAPGPAFDAEIYTLYVAEALRSQQLGCRLMASLATRLQLFGHGSVMLWCLQENVRARGFYERLGGRPAGTREEWFGGAALKEIGYGWPRIETLQAACSDDLAIADGAVE